MAAVLLAGGTKGKRFALPHSRVLLHQPLMYGLQGQATDIDIHAKDLMRLRERLNEILANHTGQAIDKINADTERDFILEADSAHRLRDHRQDLGFREKETRRAG